MPWWQKNKRLHADRLIHCKIHIKQKSNTKEKKIQRGKFFPRCKATGTTAHQIQVTVRRGVKMQKRNCGEREPLKPSGPTW